VQPPKPETVSLIDEKQKTERKRTATSLRPFRALPSISKLKEPEATAAPAPVETTGDVDEPLPLARGVRS
jgi:hypothetical protein